MYKDRAESLFMYLNPAPTEDQNQQLPVAEMDRWNAKRRRFKLLLAYEAYESAMISLIPNGFDYSIHSCLPGDKEAFARLHYKRHKTDAIQFIEARSHQAPIALALCLIHVKDEGIVPWIK